MAPASTTDQSVDAQFAERFDAKPKLRKLKFARIGAAGVPSPLAGEGGSSRSEEQGEGKRPKQKRSKRVVAEQVAFARNLRVHATDAERKLWSILRQPPLSRAKFRRQVPIGPFVADFLSYSERLIVEADGGQHSESASDRRRDGWLRNNGFRVLRFWNTDILKNTEGVVSILLRHIDHGEDNR